MDDERLYGAEPLRAPVASTRATVDLGLTESVHLAVWYAAVARGATGLDEARDAIVGDDAAHDVIGLPNQPEPVPLVLALGLLRVEGAVTAAIALPVPGDPVGLAGPPSFNAEALEAGQAVLLPGAELGLVPTRAGAGVVWRCFPASPQRQVPDLAEADRALRAELPRVATRLAELQVARWRPEIADELRALRTPVRLRLPSGASPRGTALLAMSQRCLTIVALAEDDDGGAISAWEMTARREALRDLDRAARRAQVAAVDALAAR